MDKKEIIKELEEYLQSGLWRYTEPELGKEECELFLKYLKQEEEKSKNKTLYRGVAIYKTEHGYEPSVSANTLDGCKNFLDVVFDGIRYYPLKDICTTPREKWKTINPQQDCLKCPICGKYYIWAGGSISLCPNCGAEGKYEREE